MMLKEPEEADAVYFYSPKEKMGCWNPNCKKTSIIEDRAGWKWCWKHFWWQRDGYFSKMRRIIWSNLFK